MSDAQIAKELFENVGHIRGRVDDIHADLHLGDEALIPRVRRLELAQASDEGGKQVRRDRRTVLLALISAAVSLALGVANYLKH